MATEGALQLIPGVKASADLSSKQFLGMKVSGVGTVTVCAAITDKVVGVLQDAPASGAPAAVAHGGKTKMIAGGVVTAGDLVGVTSAGKAVTIVAGTDTTQYILGRALTTSATDGDYIEVLLFPGGRCA